MQHERHAGPPGAGHHPAVEQYLETILELEESGVVPMRARLVERLGVSAPAVSETV
jgi:DtxR family Mn-dependent transcriptional regulator